MDWLIHGVLLGWITFIIFRQQELRHRVKDLEKVARRLERLRIERIEQGRNL